MQRALNIWMAMPREQKQALWQSVQYNQGYYPLTNDQICLTYLFFYWGMWDKWDGWINYPSDPYQVAVGIARTQNWFA